MIAQTIDEVIEHLTIIIEESKLHKKRQGYFASLYKRVTVEIKQKIEARYFEDNERMEKLDVTFANRYLQAYTNYRNNQPCSQSWQASFSACDHWRPTVLQHLFLGMNAHIGLDLGIAAATVCPGPSIESLHNDFNKINVILSSLVDTVEDEVADIWPLLKPIDLVAGKLEEEIASFSMEIARDAAWQVAVDYAPLSTPSEQANYIQQRDAKVAGFGNKIYKPGVVLQAVILLFRMGEIGNIPYKISQLDS